MCWRGAQGLMGGARGPFLPATALVDYGCVGWCWPLEAYVRLTYLGIEKKIYGGIFYSYVDPIHSWHLTRQLNKEDLDLCTWVFRWYGAYAPANTVLVQCMRMSMQLEDRSQWSGVHWLQHQILLVLCLLDLRVHVGIPRLFWFNFFPCSGMTPKGQTVLAKARYEEFPPQKTQKMPSKYICSWLFFCIFLVGLKKITA